VQDTVAALEARSTRPRSRGAPGGPARRPAGSLLADPARVDRLPADWRQAVDAALGSTGWQPSLEWRASAWSRSRRRAVRRDGPPLAPGALRPWMEGSPTRIGSPPGEGGPGSQARMPPQAAGTRLQIGQGALHGRRRPATDSGREGREHLDDEHGELAAEGLEVRQGVAGSTASTLWLPPVPSVCSMRPITSAVTRSPVRSGRRVTTKQSTASPSGASVPGMKP